jgi:hypothetical protein
LKDEIERKKRQVVSHQDVYLGMWPQASDRQFCDTTGYFMQRTSLKPKTWALSLNLIFFTMEKSELESR